MFRKASSGLATLTAIVALLMGWAAIVTLSPFCAAAREESTSFSRTPVLPSTENNSGSTASPCAEALAQSAVCVAANQRALEIINASHLEAFTVVQDVRTGALVAFAASQPSTLDVTTPVLPLSLSKLLLSASWWDNRQPDSSFDSLRGTASAQNPAYRARVSVHEMLVGGSDSAARQMAVALRKSVGTAAVLKDFKRYGFVQRADSPRDNRFWAELAPSWQARLEPAPAYASLSNEMKDTEWADTLSIGEANMSVTGLHISRFLQAVGNNGVMLSPVAREEQPAASLKRLRRSRPPHLKSARVMSKGTALRLQAAMREVVQRGTARSIATSLADTGWQIGGKTGTGPGPAPIGPTSDGWFAGLIFDPQGRARFTVATYVRHGGQGGGNAARISAMLARYMIGDNGVVSR